MKLSTTIFTFCAALASAGPLKNLPRSDEGALEYMPPPADGSRFLDDPRFRGHKDLMDGWANVFKQGWKKWPPNHVKEVPVVEMGPEVEERGIDEADIAKSVFGSLMDFVKNILTSLNTVQQWNHKKGPLDLNETLDKWKKEVLELRTMILAKESALAVYKELGYELAAIKKRADKLLKKIEEWEKKYKGKNKQKVGDYQRLLLEYNNCKTSTEILNVQISITLKWITDLKQLIKCKSDEINKAPAQAQGDAGQIDGSAVEEAKKLLKQDEEGMAGQEEMLQAEAAKAEQLTAELAEMEQRIAGLGEAEQQKPEQQG